MEQATTDKAPTPNEPQDKEKQKAAENKAAWLAFDNRTWSDFKMMYKSHNNFMKTIESLSSSASAVALYDKCTEFEDYFRNAS